jgi:hypothetical protein
MPRAHLFLIALLASLALIGRVDAQIPTEIPVTIPVGGQYVFLGNQAGFNSTTAFPNQLFWLDSDSGIFEIITTEDISIGNPRWNRAGSEVAYRVGLEIILREILNQGVINLKHEYLPSIESWSSDDTNLLYIWHDGNTQPASSGVNILNRSNFTTTELFSLQRDQIITDFPLPPLPPEVTQLTFREIRQADWNPAYPDWIVVQIRGYTPEITLADLGEGTNFPITIAYNLQAGQMLSLDALFSSPISTTPIRWSPDGRFLLLQTDEIIPGKTYIVAFEHDGQDWTLNVVDGAPSEFQAALDWLGAGDLLLSATREQETGDGIYYIAQIIDGNWHYTEFFRLPASMFDRTGNGDWHITADEAERHQLSCLFDQAQSARFGVGDRARVNFTDGTPLREAPDLDAAEITQMPEGTEFDVIGGPACINASDYYRFWQIELNDSTTGWAAEAGMTDYFMEPVPDDVLTADAGPDQTVTAADGISAQVTLDGSGSFDPDEEIVSYVT